MSKDSITVDQLTRICEDKTWEDFEAMPDGQLLLREYAQTILPVEEDVNPLLWLFTMRVGKHFERPVQAIMSCGHFIRMRSAEPWGVAQLGKLDPTHPDTCLYAQATALSFSWRPYIWAGQTISAAQNAVGSAGPALGRLGGSGGRAGGAGGGAGTLYTPYQHQDMTSCGS